MNNKTNQKILVVLIMLIIISVGVAIIIGKKTMHRQTVQVTGNSPPPTATPTPATEQSDMTSQPNLTLTSVQEQTSTNTADTTISLEIIQPADGSQVTGQTVIVTGKTAPYSDVFINDKQSTADASGNFSQSMTLDEGDNVIAVAANDQNGNYAEKEITVTYNPSQTQ